MAVGYITHPNSVKMCEIKALRTINNTLSPFVIGYSPTKDTDLLGIKYQIKKHEEHWPYLIWNWLCLPPLNIGMWSTVDSKNMYWSLTFHTFSDVYLSIKYMTLGQGAKNSGCSVKGTIVLGIVTVYGPSHYSIFHIIHFSPQSHNLTSILIGTHAHLRFNAFF